MVHRTEAMAAAVFSMSVFALVGLFAPAAGAATTQPCHGTIAGGDIGRLAAPSSALSIGRGPSVPFTLGTTRSQFRYRVVGTMLGNAWPVASGQSDSSTVKATLSPTRVARFGSGLYKLRLQALGHPGCTSIAYVKVSGSPLSSWAGRGAVLALIVAVIALAVGSRLSSEQHEQIKTVLYAEGRARARPRTSLLALLGGLIGAAAALALLRHFALVYPTLSVAIATAVAGVVAGVVIPTLYRWVVIVRYRGRFATRQ